MFIYICRFKRKWDSFPYSWQVRHRQTKATQASPLETTSKRETSKPKTQTRNAGLA
jgi:hypothetical protein